MFAIGIRYYAGAASLSDGDGPEWPPHPDRLFQALAATAWERDFGDASDRIFDALRVLEAEPPPALRCPAARAVEEHTLYVPNNFTPAHSRDAHRIPVLFPLSEPCVYLWPNLPPATADVLKPLVAELSYLGRADSQVVAEVLDDPPPPNIVPDDDGGLFLRTPHAGRLEQLRAAYESGLASFACRARTQAYRPAKPAVPSGPYGEWLSMRLRGPSDLRFCVHYTQKLRAAVQAKLGDPCPASVHGHGADRHAAWIGLADVGHVHARGRLLGLAMLLPKGIAAAERAQAVQGLREVEHLHFDECTLEVSHTANSAMTFRRGTWSRPSRTWATATPVVLDKFPKPGLSAERIVAEGLARQGYPEPARVELGQFSPLAGVPRSGEFRLRKPGRLYCHAVLEFAEAVAGPLLLGMERHFGLGLLRPLDDGTEREESP